MPQVQVTLKPDRSHPIAGEQFQVTAELLKPASEDLLITFEKHRVYVDTSGNHELCVIQNGYFTEDGFPSPIELERGESSGSTNVTVSAKAVNPPCPQIDPPDDPILIEFPDPLMLTAFVKTAEAGTEIGKEHLVLTISSKYGPDSNL